MLKKIYSIIAVMLASIALYACTPEATTVQLPVLNGLNETQITTKLDELGFDFEIFEEMNLQVTEGTFVRYGNNKVPGAIVDPKDESLVIYIASHKMILPDLTGLDEAGIKAKLKGFDIKLVFSYRQTLDVEEGLFIEYDGTFAAGNEVYRGSNVPIILASYPDAYKSPVFISKYVAAGANNKALEIFNAADNELDLSDYTLDFYLDGSDEVSHSYTLAGGTKLAAKDTLLLVHPDAELALREKADILVDALTFNGNDYITLNDHKGALIDAFGEKGVAIVFFANQIRVRKSNIIQSNNQFDTNEWDIYYKHHYEILDEHPTDFPDGFTYNPEHLELDFFTQPNGMLKVTYISNNDGDTARFEELNESVRFTGINTRETSDPDPKVRELAYAAGAFVQQRLSNATEIYVHHDPYSGNTETYGRYLAFVWYDGKLVNYEVVLHGHSENNYNDPNETLVYNGVTLNEWFRRAESYARANRLGVWA